jgi:hypothetical protein
MTGATNMTLDELKQLLDDLTEEHDLPGETEVRIAMQPTYPFEYSTSDRSTVVNGILYLAEGDQLSYLPSEVSRALGWR